MILVYIIAAIVGLLAFGFYLDYLSGRKYEKRYNNSLSKYALAVKSGDVNQIVNAGIDLLETNHLGHIHRNHLDEMYFFSLSLLKENPNLKEYALKLGRKRYRKHMNKSESFYEVAIQNDINAAL